MFFVTQKTNHPDYNLDPNPGYLKKDNESEQQHIKAYVPSNGSFYVKFTYFFYDIATHIGGFQNSLGAGHIKNSVDTTAIV
jgi:hypothetical protein